MKVRPIFLIVTLGILLHLFVAVLAIGYMDWMSEPPTPTQFTPKGKPHHGYQIYPGESFNI